MNEMLFKKLIPASLLCMAAGMISCVDDNYDLNKDIDTTIGVGGDLSIPGGSTENITLKKIFDLDDNSIVQADKTTGDYALIKAGNATAKDIEVEPIYIGDIGMGEGSKVELPFSQIPVNQYTISVKDEEGDDKFKYDVDKSDISTDIIRLLGVDVDWKTVMCFDLKSGSTEGFITIKQGSKINYPRYMTISVEDNDYEVLEGHILQFKEDTKIPANGKLEIPVNVTHLNLDPELNLENDPGDIKGNGQHFRLYGSVLRDMRIYFDKNDFKPVEDPGRYVILKTDMHVSDMNLARATAIVDPEINIDVEPVEITNLPDFLADEEVVIDAYNPRIYLNLENQLDATGNLQATLVATKNKQETARINIGIPADAETDEGRIKLLPGKNAICLSRRGEGAVEGGRDITVPDLDKLIRTIPDEITMENVDARILPEPCTVEFGQSYGIKADYEVNTPLAFGPETHIVYNDTIDGWSSDLEDISFKHAEIQMEITNCIPLKLEMSATPVDKDCNPLPGIEVNVDNTINAGLPESPETVSIAIRLYAENGIRNLDGLRLKIVSLEPEPQYYGKVLNETQTLQMKNIHVKVKGGINIDLN